MALSRSGPGLGGLLLFPQSSSVGATDGEQFLFGHDNSNHTIIRIDTATGQATVVGETGFQSTASALATARGPVPGADGATFAAGTNFGLLKDASLRADFVVAVDTITGSAMQVVQTSRLVAARGIAFGKDGVTLFVIEGSGELSRIDTVTGAITLVGDTGFPSDSLEFDPDSGSFFAISGNTLVKISESDASATIVGSEGGLGNLEACTLVRSPEGTWFTIHRGTGNLITVNVEDGTLQAVVGPLGPAPSNQVCGTAFAPALSLPAPSAPGLGSGLAPEDGSGSAQGFILLGALVGFGCILAAAVILRKARSSRRSTTRQP